MTPLFTLGTLNVTPYSLLVFAGALAGTALSWRKKAVRPLLPAVILGALVFGHAFWVLFCPADLESAEGTLHMLLRPWQGGYALCGALAGGALGALAAGKAAGVRWLDAADALVPGACAALFFIRIGEAFTGEGIGRWTEVEWTHFFPLSVCTYQDEYFQEWRYVVWVWEALAALALMILLLKREKKAPAGHQTVLFLTWLGVSQILLEQMRQDNYLRVITFVRVNQLGAIAVLITVLLTLILRRRPSAPKVFWSLAVLVLASLADMASEFVFDKFEYAPWLYYSMIPAAAATAAMLWVWRKRKGLLPAALICCAAAALLIGYASCDWANMDMGPVDEMIRFQLLYGTMAVDMACISLAVSLNLKEKPAT